jgi:hypothetical protein
MKIKTLGRYAIDMLRGQQQQVEKNQYEEHLDQLKIEQQELDAQRTRGGYISPYQNNPYQGMGQQGQLNKHLDAHLNAHINAQFDAQKALGAMNTQSVSNIYYAGGGGGGGTGVAYGGGVVMEPPVNLEEGAWVAAISELENLWLVKFGSKWVQHPELDEFYKVAVARLISAKKMETHHLTQISLPVYRIIE